MSTLLATIIAFSDTQFDDGSVTRNNAIDVSNQLSGLSWDLIFYVGDPTNGTTSTQEDDWNTYMQPYTDGSEAHGCPGNHDYSTDSGSFYWTIWGSRGGTSPNAPWHSFDYAGWHFIFCDSNGGVWNSIQNPSTQYTWLHNDLDANLNKPTICVWHWGRFSASSAHGNDTDAAAAFQLLYDHGVEILLSGHQHNYERYDRLDPSGNVDSANGVRQWTLPASGQVTTNSESGSPVPEVYDTGAVIGPLKLLLYDDKYTWELLATSGHGSLTDTGEEYIRFALDETSGPNSAATATALGGGSGSWSNVTNAQGAPNTTVASWTAP